MTSEHDDVRALLERAADLAPDRLDRPSVAGQVRSRAARRAAGAGLAAAFIAGAALLVVPALDGGGEQRLAQEPPSGGPTGNAPEPGAGSQTFTVRYVDAAAYDEAAARRDLDRCTALPGADHTVSGESLPPQPVVTATGTAEQRGVVEDCLRALPNTDVQLVRTDITESPVYVSADSTGLEPLEASVSPATPARLGNAWVTHDLTLTNTSSDPVYVDALVFHEELSGQLFVSIGCGLLLEERCDADYGPHALGPGQAATFEVVLSRGLAGMQPLEAGRSYTADIPIQHRTTGPFGTTGYSDGTRTATVSITYDIAVGAPLGDSAERASFLSLSDPGRNDERRFRAARAEGVLSGDPSSGCLWLSDDGSDGTPIVIVHDTAVADFDRDPWVIRDGDTVLATAGDKVVLGGGYGPNGEQGAVPGCPVTGAPFFGQLN